MNAIVAIPCLLVASFNNYQSDLIIYELYCAHWFLSIFLQWILSDQLNLYSVEANCNKNSFLLHIIITCPANNTGMLNPKPTYLTEADN